MPPAQRWIWTLCLHIWTYRYSSSTFSNFSKVTHWSWVIKVWLTKFQFILKVFDAVEVKTFWRPVCFSATSNLGIFSLSPSKHGSVMMLKQKRMSLKQLLPCWKWNCVEFIRQWKQWLHIIYILTTKWTATKVQLQEKVLYSVIWSELTESGLQSTRSHYLFNKMFTF